MTGHPGTACEPYQAYHLTCVVNELLPLFSQPEVVAILFDALRELRERYGLRLHSWVVMEEHLHLLVRAEHVRICLEYFREETTGRIVAFLEERRLERFLARLPRDAGGRPLLWQEPAELEPVGEGEMGSVMEYIHINPVKRGYVERPEQWRYSSARDYGGGKGLVVIDRWEIGGQADRGAAPQRRLPCLPS